MARRAVLQFPDTSKYGTLDYNTAMKALAEAGLPFRPYWQLVDDIREVFATVTNPAGITIAIDEVYYRLFGRTYTSPTETHQPDTSAAIAA